MLYANTADIIRNMKAIRFDMEMDAETGFEQVVDNIVAASFVYARDLVQGSKDKEAMAHAMIEIKETRDFAGITNKHLALWAKENSFDVISALAFFIYQYDCTGTIPNACTRQGPIEAIETTDAGFTYMIEGEYFTPEEITQN